MRQSDALGNVTDVKIPWPDGGILDYDGICEAVSARANVSFPSKSNGRGSISTVSSMSGVESVSEMTDGARWAWG